MKTKRSLLLIFTLCAALSLTACNGKQPANTEKPQDTQTESSAASSDDSSSELDDLYQQENQLFADHKDVWDKVFGMMNKSELKILNDDIETIREIEEKITAIEKKNAASDSNSQKNNSDDVSPFKDFSAKDFDGNSVDESLFSKNAVTVVNFWFTGCKPCVAELSKLNELNDAIKASGGEVVGINTETFDGNETAIKEAADILKRQGAKYRNLSVDSTSDAGKYASNIMAFPTTILVDRNGNIVGDPMLGGIDNQENYDALMKQIQSVIDADSANK